VHVQRAVVDVADLVPGDHELVGAGGSFLDDDDVLVVFGEGDPGDVEPRREGGEPEPDRTVQRRAERGAQRVQERLGFRRRLQGAGGVPDELGEEPLGRSSRAHASSSSLTVGVPDGIRRP
jgi:hypothetical protein